MQLESVYFFISTLGKKKTMVSILMEGERVPGVDLSVEVEADVMKSKYLPLS